MKPVHRLPHALKNLVDRETEREHADRTLADPELIVPGQTGRKVFMRRYFDTNLQHEMLLRIILEETTEEVVVVTVYKTSQIDRYLKGRIP